MKRREFIAGVGGAAAWPLVAARAQQGERMRRVGYLGVGDDGPGNPADLRWTGGDINRIRAVAQELVDLRPDVILSPTTPVTAAFQRETRAIPIIFVMVADPVGEGFVASVPRPVGNITGFKLWEPTMSGKWLELLTEIAPSVRRVAIMFNPEAAPYITPYLLPSFESAARSFKVEPTVAPVHSVAEIETLITSLGREPGGGLVPNADPFTEVNRALIASLAAQNKVPAVYPNSGWVRAGGLLSFGANMADEFHRAAAYVDRILRGANPADLPVQSPVKFEMALNAKTAKELGLTVLQSILLRADEVIE